MKSLANSILPGLLLVGAIFFIFSNVEQSEFNLLFVAYSLAFGSYVIVVQNAKVSNLWIWIGLGMALRIASTFYFPSLSDDIYRFYWDGMLWQEGIHPFDFRPSELMGQLSANPEFSNIYPLLNSQDYYTIYPPVCQWVFWITVQFSNSIEGFSVVLKIWFLILELLSVYGLLLLIRSMGMRETNALYYFLNPLIIVELSGNLHFEAFMVCALIWMVYFLMKKQWAISGSLYALAIMSKLLPLLLGPYLLFYLWKRKKHLSFFVPAGLLCFFGFGLMLFGSDLTHLLKSINLYFQNFEFNASIYYILRELGILITGYNQIWIIGPVLSLFSAFLICKYSYQWSKQDDFRIEGIAILFFIYLIFGTTIHPWYLAVPLTFAMTSNLRIMAVLWSYLAFLSYSAYDTQPVSEHIEFWIIEYGLLFITGLWLFRGRIHDN